MVLPAVSPHSAGHGQACFCSDLSREAPGQERRATGHRGLRRPQEAGTGGGGSPCSRPLIKTHWPWGTAGARERRPGRCRCLEPRLQPVALLEEPGQPVVPQASAGQGRRPVLLCLRGEGGLAARRGGAGRDTALPPNCQPLKVNIVRFLKMGRREIFWSDLNATWHTVGL